MRSCASRRETAWSMALHTNPLDGEGRVGEHLLMDERELIYDWNRAGGAAGPAFDWSRVRVDLNDETLRDGLQSPSVRDPTLEVKKRLLHLMADLGIVAADIGLPGAGPRVVEQVRVLAREIRDAKLPIAPNCAARTVVADVEPIVRISDELGIKIEAATFIGSSPIRQYAEDWTLERIVKASAEAVTYAVQHGLPVMYVTEDTTRARPETLKALYGAAIDCGATRLCLADTVGHATHQLPRRDRGGGGPRARDGARGRGAGRERRDGPAARQPQAAGHAPPRHPPPAGVLRARGAGGGHADPRELSRGRDRRVPDRDRRACGGDHQGEKKGARLARRPRVQLGAGGGVRLRATDRDLAGLRVVEREVLARNARV